MALRVCSILSRLAQRSTPRPRISPSNLRHSSTANAARQWSTPLAKTIADAIATTGPISIAAYMRQCLTSPEGGYYTTNREGQDQFGQKGDFVTSPEISQIFGELLGIWLEVEWQLQGRKKHGVEIIEVGPGRGTLIDDILRVRALRPFLETHIAEPDKDSQQDGRGVEHRNPALRNAQKKLLCGDAPLEETTMGYQSISKYARLPITWCEDIRFVPNGRPLCHSRWIRPLIISTEADKTPFIFAHEFFDALPIHAFQSVPPSPSPSHTLATPTGPISLNRPSPEASKPQWRELLVTPTSPPSTFTSSASSPTSAYPKEPKDDFQLTLAKASNPSSLLLPSYSPRYKALLPHAGSIIEISPESHGYAAEFARRIGGSASSKSSTAQTSTPPAPHKANASGAALILDYGPSNTIPTSTLRGIRSHQLVSPFSSPGFVDLSADVDFTALVEAALGASENVEVHGPVEQGTFLEQMGIWDRADQLQRMLDKKGGESMRGRENFKKDGTMVEVDASGKSEEQERKKAIREAVERLVSRLPGRGMGTLYKALAIVPERGGRRPVGFGGDF
ncbi:MAG: hypothetical protein Q9208_003484 [Pyrenodesmia sp. 3 TL-2023]